MDVVLFDSVLILLNRYRKTVSVGAGANIDALAEISSSETRLSAA